MKKLFVLRHIGAVLKGIIFRLYFAMFYSNRVAIGKWLRVYCGSEVRCSGQGKLKIGQYVSMGKYSIISSPKVGNIIIGNHVGISDNCHIVGHKYIEIGENTILAPGVLIYDHNHKFGITGVQQKKFSVDKVIIGKNCWIGAYSIILKGSKIGNNCVIAAGSIICGTIPDNTIVIQKRESIMREITNNE